PGIVNCKADVWPQSAHGGMQRSVVIDDVVFGDLQDDRARPVREDGCQLGALGQEYRRDIEASSTSWSRA
ncbi:MAG: hypothetical protein ABJC24_10275, partial [Chloroflexota bacterium]